MTAPRQGTDPASIRGIAILAVAVVLGFLLLGGSDELSLSTTSKSSADDPVTTTTEFTVPDQAAPTTAPPPGAGVVKPPAEVKVIVLNGSGGLAKGVAGSSTTKLGELGYQTLEPDNASAREVTVVQFAAGFQPNAEAIKTALGLSGTVELMEAPTADAKDANVVVVLGQDAASLVEGDGAVTTTTEG
jgi:hypothetical protein